MAYQNPDVLRGTTFRTGVRLFIILVSLVVSLVVYFRLFGTPYTDIVSRWTASSTAQALNLLGASVATNGTVVGSSDFAYNVVVECTAIGPIILFVGAVIAFPAALWSKALGIGIGVVFLTTINLVRLVSLFYIGAVFPDYLPMAHFLVWQAAIIISAILLWLFWVDRFARGTYE